MCRQNVSASGSLRCANDSRLYALAETNRGKIDFEGTSLPDRGCRHTHGWCHCWKEARGYLRCCCRVGDFHCHDGDPGCSWIRILDRPACTSLKPFLVPIQLRVAPGFERVGQFVNRSVSFGRVARRRQGQDDANHEAGQHDRDHLSVRIVEQPVDLPEKRPLRRKGGVFYVSGGGCGRSDFPDLAVRREVCRLVFVCCFPRLLFPSLGVA